LSNLIATQKRVVDVIRAKNAIEDFSVGIIFQKLMSETNDIEEYGQIGNVDKVEDSGN
jgi:DNA phosphorothioation-dependent restriction protein DptG